MDYWNEYRWSQRKIINKDASKDIRTSEFEVSKASGKVNGTISVYINEPVNGKPFKYDHHYNIFKFDGKDSGATGSPNIVQDKSNVENPQTSGGIPTYTYLIPIVSLFALITISVMTFKLKKVTNNESMGPYKGEKLYYRFDFMRNFNK